MRRMMAAVSKSIGDERETLLDALERFGRQRGVTLCFCPMEELGRADLLILGGEEAEQGRVLRATNPGLVILLLGGDVEEERMASLPVPMIEKGLLDVWARLDLPTCLGEPRIHAFKCHGSIVNVNEADIVYIDIYKHYLSIHTDTDIYVSRGNIKDVLLILSGLFSRCSNYCIVNLSRIECVDKDDVILRNGECLKITAKYKEGFLRDFVAYTRVHQN